MTGIKVGVLALQGDVQEHCEHLQAVGATPVPVRRVTELAEVFGLIIPGGESTTIYKLLRDFKLFAPLQEEISIGFPVYGSCAGMIMLADKIIDGVSGQETLGGLDISVRRNAFGRQVNSYEEDLVAPEFSGSEPLRAVFIRAPWVEQAGPDVEVLARTGVEHGEAIVAVREANLLATSFHPEVVSDVAVHRYFVDRIVLPYTHGK